MWPCSGKEAVVPVGVDALETELGVLRGGSTVRGYGSLSSIEAGVRTLSGECGLTQSVRVFAVIHMLTQIDPLGIGRRNACMDLGVQARFSAEKDCSWRAEFAAGA